MISVYLLLDLWSLSIQIDGDRFCVYFRTAREKRDSERGQDDGGISQWCAIIHDYSFIKMSNRRK